MAQMRDPQKGVVYIVAESRMDSIPGAVPKQKKGKKASEPAQKGFEVCSLHLLCYLCLFVALNLTAYANTLPVMESLVRMQLSDSCSSSLGQPFQCAIITMALSINVRAATMHVIEKTPVCNLEEFG